jgi:hypothetical protein
MLPGIPATLRFFREKKEKGGQPDLPYFLGARVNFLLLTKK